MEYNIKGLKEDYRAILAEKRWAKKRGLYRQWQRLARLFNTAIKESNDE